ncbi:MAG: hypothetical protein Q4A81_09280 [Pasteurellaceae bacterium]|nr:hypothetical protein [Pasteurellaceae bacterium]
MKGYKAAIMAVIMFIATHVYAVHIDDNTALQLAPTGDVDAQAQLANSYLVGTDRIQINYQQAKYWAEKAYAQGNHRAELVLGILYLNGYAVQQDYAKARQLFEQANQAGEMKAARYLGLIYLNG